MARNIRLTTDEIASNEKYLEEFELFDANEIMCEMQSCEEDALILAGIKRAINAIKFVKHEETYEAKRNCER